MTCQVTEIHPYVLSKHSALAQVSGCAEEGWLSWFVPQGLLQVPEWDPRGWVSAVKPWCCLTDRFCLRKYKEKYKEKSRFTLWNAVAVWGWYSAEMWSISHTLELQPAQSNLSNAAHILSRCCVSTSVCLTTSATSAYQHEFQLAGKLPTQSLETEKESSDYDK